MGVERVCLAAVAGAHGVRGLVKLKTFTTFPEDVASYGALTDQDGLKHYDITLKGQVKDTLLAQIAGVADRDAAQALRGTRLYVERSALPQPQDPEDFYHADLVNLRVETEAGETLGRVKAVLSIWTAADWWFACRKKSRLRRKARAKATATVGKCNQARPGSPAARRGKQGFWTGQRGSDAP